MVTEYRTGETGGNADDHQGEVSLKDLGDNGDKNTEGAPGGAGGKRQSAGNQIDNGPGSRL